MTNNDKQRNILFFDLNERNLAVMVHSLFSSWMLSFLFEGQIFQQLAKEYNFASESIIIWSSAAMFSGLLLGGFTVKSKLHAKRLFLFSYPFFIALSLIFFFSPSILWTMGIITGSIVSGCCIAAWGFYFKSVSEKNERIKTAADMLIISNILMILLNVVAINISPNVGLTLSLVMLIFAFILGLRLPTDYNEDYGNKKDGSLSISNLLLFFYIFIVILTINSGLMYHVVNPAFEHHATLTSWYWAVPYVAVILILRIFSQKIMSSYILYVAIAMIGLSFIAFIALDRSAISYFIINTLMLGSYGVYDLFFWSIFGEMLDYHKNPAKILGTGLSANVLGIVAGGLIGNSLMANNLYSINPSLFAFAVVCVSLVLLPLLNKYLSTLLKGYTFLTAFVVMPEFKQNSQIDKISEYGNLSEREKQVALLLLQGKTYKTIAGELFISENTVKYYVKNIYSKFNIQSRAELIDMVAEKQN
ncbi:MAG TPA: LuxR C-terminal-related transcriptional regulator [Sedimentibacter sp.]|nr:helix-turn-helix transcriptional regulator [Clostridiales bacterium]HOA20138.1 LuxR C-terminal-related transcriptional regulator [Sedimentibacter sp.]HOT21418.1 LuxR C-terminal-related transcriptional regulator [Sedimentibacter sp.]HPY56519.1 LuxR C-terminal-related transcriptional regulator [Sedimentibacter sp.]HQK53460.1 LuxR C-terminal-related transcriptional regulator [Sedimentibacter sp.]